VPPVILINLKMADLLPSVLLVSAMDTPKSVTQSQVNAFAKKKRKQVETTVKSEEIFYENCLKSGKNC